MNKWLIVFVTTCVTLEKPHCGISKGILACLILASIAILKNKELENKIEVNDLKIIGTKKKRNEESKLLDLE